MSESPVGKLFKSSRRQPTQKQMKALQFHAEGNSVRKSMILAGYSVKTANKGATVFKNVAVRRSLLGLRDYVEKNGMNTEKMGDKLLKWIDAEKDIYSKKGEYLGTAPDNEMQKYSFDQWMKLQQLDSKLNPDGKVKRRMTIEEFVGKDEETDGAL